MQLVPVIERHLAGEPTIQLVSFLLFFVLGQLVSSHLHFIGPLPLQVSNLSLNMMVEKATVKGAQVFLDILPESFHYMPEAALPLSDNEPCSWPRPMSRVPCRHS